MPYASFPTQRQHLERRLVRRAWSEPEFRARLLDRPKETLESEFGIRLPDGFNVEVVEERPDSLCIVIPVDVSGIPAATVEVMLGDPPGPRR